MGRDRISQNTSSNSPSNSSDDVIETYIQRLLAWKEPLTAATLESLAADAGLGEAEIAAVQAKAQAHLKRGQNYLNFDCLDDAIEELTQAAALSPLDLEILHYLSEAYAQRYQLKKSAQDKDNCITTAKRCLEIDPEDTQAVTCIKSLEAKTKIATLFNHRLLKNSPLKHQLKHQLIAGGLIALLPIVGLGYVWGSDRIPRPLTSLLTAVTPNNGETANATEGEVDIPIEFDYPGLTLQTQLSRLTNYPDSSFYTFNGVFLNQSNQEIDAADLKVTYLDTAGNEIDTDSEEAIADYTPPIRPGDSHDIHVLKELNPKLAKVKLSVATIDQLPAANTYPPSPPIAYEWAFTQPTHLNFELVARKETVSYTYTNQFNGHWVIINQGDTAIRELKLKIDFYDRQDQLMSTDEEYVTITSYASIMPGERRPFIILEDVSEDYSHYKVTVISAE